MSDMIVVSEWCKNEGYFRSCSSLELQVSLKGVLTIARLKEHLSTGVCSDISEFYLQQSGNF
jgi:hypothetical protein